MNITQHRFNENLKHLPTNAAMKLILNSGIRRKYSKLLVYWYVDELSYSDIADRLCMTEESVGNSLCLARKELKSILELNLNEDIKKEAELLFR